MGYGNIWRTLRHSTGSCRGVCHSLGAGSGAMDLGFSWGGVWRLLTGMAETQDPKDIPALLGLTPERIAKYAGWLKVEAVIFMILGVLAILLPGAFSLGLELFLGWLFFIGGIFAAIGSFQAIQAKGFLLRLASAIVTAVAGLLLIMKPMQGVLVLTLVVAAFYLIDGICKIIYSLQAKGTPGTGLAIVNGIFGLIIAGIVYAEWPLSANWFLGLIIGINLLMGGMFLFTLASGINKGGPGIGGPKAA